MTLSKVIVKDGTVEKLLERAVKKDHDGICGEAAKTLDTFAHIPVTDRMLYVPVKQRRQLEEVFQTTIETPQQLVDKVSRLAKLKFGTIEYPITEARVHALQMQATFHGKTTEEWIKMTLDHIMEELLGRI